MRLIQKLTHVKLAKAQKLTGTKQAKAQKRAELAACIEARAAVSKGISYWG
jgi:hypothetical protein